MKKVNIKRKNVMKRKVKNEHGAIVVEATIAFTAFIFLIFIILYIISLKKIDGATGDIIGAAIELSETVNLFII